MCGRGEHVTPLPLREREGAAQWRKGEEAGREAPYHPTAHPERRRGTTSSEAEMPMEQKEMVLGCARTGPSSSLGMSGLLIFKTRATTQNRQTALRAILSPSTGCRIWFGCQVAKKNISRYLTGKRRREGMSGLGGFLVWVWAGD
jgi:hypothetical protein